MKKIALLLFVILLSCSKDEEPNQTCSYTISLLTECGNINTKITYEITKSEYTYWKNQQIASSCENVTIKDKNGNFYNGYYKGIATNCKN